MYTITSVAAMCTSDEFQDRILASVVQTLKHQMFASVVQTLKHHSTRLDHPETYWPISPQEHAAVTQWKHLSKMILMSTTLTFCMLGKFASFYEIIYSRKSFRNTIKAPVRIQAMLNILSAWSGSELFVKFISR